MTTPLMQRKMIRRFLSPPQPGDPEFVGPLPQPPPSVPPQPGDPEFVGPLPQPPPSVPPQPGDPEFVGPIYIPPEPTPEPEPVVEPEPEHMGLGIPTIPEPPSPIQFLITHADPSESQALKTTIEKTSVISPYTTGVTTVSYERRKQAESTFQQQTLLAQSSLHPKKRQEFIERFVESGQIKDTESALQFLLEFTSPTVSSNLQSAIGQLEASPLEPSPESVGRLEIRQQKAIEQTYQSLTPEEKKKFAEKFPELITYTKSPEQIALEAEREAIRSRITGTPEERLAEMARFVSSFFINPEAVVRTGIQVIRGGPEAGERILDILAGQSIKFKPSVSKGIMGIPELFIESYKPGGFGFTASLAAITFGVGKAALPGLAAKGVGGAILAKGVPLAIGGGFAAVAGAEIGKTFALEKAKQLPPGAGLESAFVYGVHFALFVGTGTIAAKGTPTQIFPRVKGTIESYTGTQLKMPPVKSWLGTYKQSSMTFLKAKLPPVQKISTFKAKGIELSMMKESPTTVRGIIAYQGPTISQSVKMGLGKVKSAFFEPTAREIMIREGFYSTKFMPASVGRLAYGKPTIRDIMAWKEMGSYVPSEYESSLLSRMALVDVKYGEKTLQLVSRMRTGEMFYKIDAKGIVGIGYKYRPISSIDIFALETGKLPVISFKGKIIDIGKYVGYRYIGETKPFKAPYTYKSFGIEDVGYRLIGKTKPFKAPYKYKSYGVEDVGYRYITKTKPLPKFKRLGWPEVYRSMEAYGIPSKPIPDIVKVSTVSKISKPTFTTIGGFKIAAPSVGQARTYMPGGWAIATGGVPLDWLEWLEEGISTGVHPRWGKISPHKIPLTTDIITPAITQIDLPIQDIGIKSILGTEELLALKPVYDVGTKKLLETKGLLQEKGLERGVTDISVIELAQVQLLAPIQQQMQAQIQKLELKYLLKLDLLTVTPTPPIKLYIQEFKYKAPEKKPPFKPRFPILFPSFEGKDEREIIEEQQQAFNVFVRERRFFKGKEIKEGKFIQINKIPLIESDALSFGGTVADRSAVRTFKIVKTSGKPKPLPIDVTPWPFIQLKFARKDDRFIEQDFAAIDTQGEIEGISALGWIAKRRKQQKAPVSIRKPRASQEIRVSKGISDIDFLQPSIDFNKNLRNFENLFRRFNHGF